MSKKGKDGQAQAGPDPSIPDWNDITAALTPQAVPGSSQPAQLSLAAGPAGQHRTPHDPVRILLDLAGAGMIVTVLCGLRRARNDSRPRPALWL